jgi:hypothetical protein
MITCPTKEKLETYTVGLYKGLHGVGWFVEWYGEPLMGPYAQKEDAEQIAINLSRGCESMF